MVTSAQSRKRGQPVFYQITIEGTIREDWSGWLNNMHISTSTGGDDSQATILTGKVADQAALRGLLCRLWDLNLTIISISRLGKEAGEKECEK